MFRLLTFAGFCQQVVIPAFSSVLDCVASMAAHKGCMRGRSMMDSVVLFNGMINHYLYDAEAWSGVFPFDAAAAFSQRWMHMVPHCIGASVWLMTVVREVNIEAKAVVRWNDATRGASCRPRRRVSMIAVPREHVGRSWTGLLSAASRQLVLA